MTRVLNILLGAGMPLNQNKSIGLQEILFKTSTIETQMQHFSDLNSKTYYVTGFQSDVIIKKFPKLNFIINKLWQSTGSAYSLFLSLTQIPNIDEFEFIYVSYGDIFVDPKKQIELLNFNESDLNILVNSEDFITQSYSRNFEIIKIGLKSYEFAGCLTIKKSIFLNFMNLLNNLIKNNSQSNLADLINIGVIKFDNVKIIPSENKWAHLELNPSVVNYYFGSKADILDRLRGVLKQSTILPIIKFTYLEWNIDRKLIVEKINKNFGDLRLIVRSSSITEDKEFKTNAGKYLSLLNISSDKDDITNAIYKVFNSYEVPNDSDQVFIQPYLTSSSYVGVAFTRTHGYSGPYRQIEISNSSDTSVITAGGKGSRMLWKIFRTWNLSREVEVPEHIRKINSALLELEEMLNYQSLDIEFAVGPDNTIFIFQVRPMVILDEYQDKSLDQDVDLRIKSIKDLISQDNQDPHLKGEKIIYSNMSDWNPAEIIGRIPGELAYSLYEYVITEKIWAIQRQQVGYSNVSVPNLMTKLGGHSYIIVNYSLQSFIPAKLNENTKKYIYKNALETLLAKPSLHDRIEFEVLPTCIDFKFLKLSNYYSYLTGINKNDLIDYKLSLREITINIINYTNKYLVSDAELKKPIYKPNKNNYSITDLQDLLSKTRDQNALKFAHLARAAFVAISILKSAVDLEIISSKRMEELIASTKNVSSQLQFDAMQVRNKKIKFEVFANKYGHLRPGTYDIESRRYFDEQEKYLIPIIDQKFSLSKEPFAFTKREEQSLNNAFKLIGLPFSSQSFLKFVHKSIFAREWSKFIFTREISDALEIIAAIGADMSLSRNQLKHLPFTFLTNIKSKSNFLLHTKQANKLIEVANYNLVIAQKLELPDLIHNNTNLYILKDSIVTPTFPVALNVLGEAFVVDKLKRFDKSIIENKIVLIESADPGYEFIFSSNISGLITAYGGPNSHIAIRCSELSIPSAIGIGHTEFCKFKSGDYIEINSSKKIISTLGLI